MLCDKVQEGRLIIATLRHHQKRRLTSPRLQQHQLHVVQHEEEDACKSRRLGFRGRRAQLGSWCWWSLLGQSTHKASRRSWSRCRCEPWSSCMRRDRCSAVGIHTTSWVIVVGPAIQLGAIVARFPGGSQHLFSLVSTSYIVIHAGLVTELASGPANIAAALPSGAKQPGRLCREGVALHANLQQTTALGWVSIATDITLHLWKSQQQRRCCCQAGHSTTRWPAAVYTWESSGAQIFRV